MHRRTPSGGSAATLLMLAALVAPGCAKRFDLKPKELARVETEAGVEPLRVYTSKKLISLYDEADVQEQFQVQRRIEERADRKQIKEIITKNTAGLILEISELNGVPLLYVTFDPSCQNKDCAYQFVETEDKRYRLVYVPPEEGYAVARSYRIYVCKRRRLKRGKRKSLAEANEVFFVKKRNGKILTVELQVKKLERKSTKTRVERQRGIE